MTCLTIWYIPILHCIFVFWVVASCGVAVGYQCFRGQRTMQHRPPKCCYPTTALHSTRTQKTMNSVFTTTKISNLAPILVSEESM